MPGLQRFAIPCLLVAVVSWGCGSPAPTDTSASATSSPIRQIDAASLPALGEYAPPLDGGRLEIAGPEGWQLAARTADYVVRFVADSGSSYPMILVKGESTTAEALTEESVITFAAALADGSAQPAKIGEHLGALQLKRGRKPNTIDQILERLIFTTVLGDRTYEFELRTREGQVAENQDALFAVIAGTRPIGDAPPESNEEAAPTDADHEKATTAAGQKELD